MRNLNYILWHLTTSGDSHTTVFYCELTSSDCVQYSVECGIPHCDNIEVTQSYSTISPFGLGSGAHSLAFQWQCEPSCRSHIILTFIYSKQIISSLSGAVSNKRIVNRFCKLLRV